MNFADFKEKEALVKKIEEMQKQKYSENKSS